MNKNEAMLHLLAGKICSGKSTLAAELGSAENTVVISEDAWLSTLFGDEMHKISDYVRYSARLRTIMAPHLTALLRSGVNVVLDFPANTPEMRAWMGTIIKAAQCRHQLHYLVSSDEACRKRLHKRNAGGNHEFSATDDQFDKITAFFVPPASEEGFDIIRHDQETKIG